MNAILELQSLNQAEHLIFVAWQNFTGGSKLWALLLQMLKESVEPQTKFG